MRWWRCHGQAGHSTITPKTSTTEFLLSFDFNASFFYVIQPSKRLPWCVRSLLAVHSPEYHILGCVRSSDPSAMRWSDNNIENTFPFFPSIQSSSILYELNTHVFVLVLIWSLVQSVRPNTTARLASIECHDVAFADDAVHATTHPISSISIHQRNTSRMHLISLNIARRGRQEICSVARRLRYFWLDFE